MILSNGFVISYVNKCIYIKLLENECVILCSYIDDIFIFGTKLNIINDTKKLLNKNINMKDLEIANIILSVKVIKCKEKYYFNTNTLCLKFIE